VELRELRAAAGLYGLRAAGCGLRAAGCGYGSWVLGGSTEHGYGTGGDRPQIDVLQRATGEVAGSSPQQSNRASPLGESVFVVIPLWAVLEQGGAGPAAVFVESLVY
jgi:hypothetical protein